VGGLKGRGKRDRKGTNRGGGELSNGGDLTCSHAPKR